ncbi:hypothetical protein MYX07_05240 [Patescibacteria group bacterium AH-259-L07]|nr:hypothetical protein [Patescibacteria group bacterium AH-259-L07]
MNKKTLIIAIIALVIIVGGVLFFSPAQPESQQKEALTIEQDLTPIELSPEEQQALQDEGIEPLSSEEDMKAKDLQNVRFSDEIDDIEADLIETDLSGLDVELELIEDDLSGF